MSPVRTIPSMPGTVGTVSGPSSAAIGRFTTRLQRIAIIVCALVAVSSTAYADKRAQVFPLSGSGLPDKLATAPAKLTKALATSINAVVASVPIEDAAGLLECDPENSTCLAAVAKSLGVERLVFGTVNHEGGKLKVTLTRFDVGPDRQQQTFNLAGGTPDQLATELVKASAALFGGVTIEEDPTPDPTPGPGPDKPVEDKGVPGKITTGTWALVGGGAVFAAAGVVMLVSAQSIKRDVQNAPTDTLDDIRRLRALEDKGVQRTLIGNVMLIGGGAALAAGVVRAIIQRKSTVVDDPIVQPVPTEGGAVIMLTVTR